MAEKIDVNELGRGVDPKSLSNDDLVASLRDGLADPDAANDIDPSLFARLVKTTGKGQLEAVMGSGVRRTVLEAIFGRMSEFYSSQGASSKRQVVHWHISGSPDGGTDDFQTVMQHGTCTVESDLTEDPRTELTMDGVQFLKVVTNNASPVTLFMTRKLKVAGDVGFATALQKMFTIPTSS